MFRLGSMIAWVHRDTGLRRFRRAYHEIPRKNGKSLEAAIVALYITFFDGEGGADGYCAATKKDQAKIVWGDAAQLVKTSILRVGIESFARSLFDPSTMSKLEALGSDSDSTDGLNPHLIIQDEFHAYKDRKMIDVLETATGARRQPVDMRITTAGDDPVSPGGDEHAYACQVLDQVIVDEAYFAFLAHADPDDDWQAPATWKKANPNYGVSVHPEDLRALAHKAKNMPAAAAAFQQKRLNVWVNTSAPWLSLEGWRRGQSTWTLESMRGEPCWIGIDLSSKIDLTAVVLAFPPTAERTAVAARGSGVSRRRRRSTNARIETGRRIRSGSSRASSARIAGTASTRTRCGRWSPKPMPSSMCSRSGSTRGTRATSRTISRSTGSR